MSSAVLILQGFLIFSCICKLKCTTSDSFCDFPGVKCPCGKGLECVYNICREIGRTTPGTYYAESSEATTPMTSVSEA